MADQVSLVAERRPGSGKGEARALRRNGRVPAVTYGTDIEATPVSVDALELLHALSTDAGENAIIQLTVDGKQHLAMAREIHRHPVKRHVLHLDFVTIRADQKVQVDVPIHVLGEVDGGVVNQTLNTLAIEVLPMDVPDQITVDVAGMEIGDVLRAGDIALPDGVELLEDPERTAVSIAVPEEVPSDEEAAEEGEVAAEAADEEATEAPAAADEGGE